MRIPAEGAPEAAFGSVLLSLSSFRARNFSLKNRGVFFRRICSRLSPALFTRSEITSGEGEIRFFPPAWVHPRSMAPSLPDAILANSRAIIPPIERENTSAFSILRLSSRRSASSCHLRYRIRPRGLSGQPRPPVIENYASVIFFEKPDLPFPRPGAPGKTAYKKERKSLAMDLIVEIDVPNVDEWHLDLLIPV